MSIRQKIAQLIAGPSSKVVESEWLDDMEYRFGCVLNHTTGAMSKTDYTLAAMYSEIDAFSTRQIEDAMRDYRLESYENDNKDLSTTLYAYIKEGAALRNNTDGATNRHPGNSVAHMLSATGWLTEDLRLALIKADPDGYGKSHSA